MWYGVVIFFYTHFVNAFLVTFIRQRFWRMRIADANTL